MRPAPRRSASFLCKAACSLASVTLRSWRVCLRRPGERAPCPGERRFAEGRLAYCQPSWLLLLPAFRRRSRGPGPCVRLCAWGLPRCGVPLCRPAPALCTEHRYFLLTGPDGTVRLQVYAWSPSCLPTRQLTRTGTSFSVAAQQDVPQAGARATLPLCAPRSPAHTPAARGGSDVSSCPALVGGRGCASLVHTALERRTSGLGRTSSPAGLGNAVRKEGGGGRVATAAWMPDSAGCQMGTRAGSRAPACFWC